MLLDDVAADLPELTIVVAHPSVPWQDEAISIATHEANAYIDLSGRRPKYFPPQLVRAASTFGRIRDERGDDIDRAPDELGEVAGLRFGDDRVDLARHDRRAGLPCRQGDLPRPERGPRTAGAGRCRFSRP